MEGGNYPESKRSRCNKRQLSRQIRRFVWWKFPALRSCGDSHITQRRRLYPIRASRTLNFFEIECSKFVHGFESSPCCLDNIHRTQKHFPVRTYPPQCRANLYHFHAARRVRAPTSQLKHASNHHK